MTRVHILFQDSVNGTVTMGRVSGLNPFTNYTCTVHAVTVSNGPMSNPVTVTTSQARMIPNHAMK